MASEFKMCAPLDRLLLKNLIKEMQFLKLHAPPIEINALFKKIERGLVKI